MQYMSKVGDQYQVHESLAEARQFEQEHNPDGYTYWNRSEKKRALIVPILLRLAIIGFAMSLPLVGTLLVLKFS